MIIMVSGLPGSGKSYFSEYLAKKLQCNYINSGQVKLALQTSGKYALKDKLVVYKEMLQQTIKAIEENKDVVVDATFYNHIMREMFIRIAFTRGVPIRVIEVIADEDIIKQRLQKPGKHSEADYSLYEKIRDDFEEITMPHLTVKSTNDNLDTMLKIAITYINSEEA
ncbi:MAG TPA: ATP-binding protein [Cyclobacteriaceae bacterium]|nr:ATP-binding protein [Cyclobacteriaceae bacterium]